MILKTHAALFLALSSFAHSQEPSIERKDPALDALIAPGTKIETLATGFRWSEGPVWDQKNGELLFSDIPNNVINAWDPEKGLRVYLKPAGFTGLAEYGKEPGSNGLTFDQKGRLILAEHGDRRVAVLTTGGGKMTIADRFDGKRLNSPNDVVVHSSGAIYFTDPIYGLPKGEKDPSRELDFCGVFRVDPTGKVTLITRDLDRPNGLAFSPDEKTLYVANSHGPAPHVYAFTIGEDGGATGPGKMFFDTKGIDGKGAPDGLKIDAAGNLWCTGPGGLLIISAEGKLLGRVLTGQPTANVAFGGTDGKTVYLTANDRLMRFQRR